MENIKKILAGKNSKRSFDKFWFCFGCPFIMYYNDMLFESEYANVNIYYKILVIVEAFMTFWICSKSIANISKLDAICVVSKINKKSYVNGIIIKRMIGILIIFGSFMTIGVINDNFSLRDVGLILLVKLVIFCIFTYDALEISKNKKYLLGVPAITILFFVIFLAIYYRLVIPKQGKRLCDNNTASLCILIFSVIVIIFFFKGIIKRKKVFINNEYYE